MIIIADSSGTVNKTQTGKVYVYDLKTLKLVQKYDALYKAYVTGIRWASDELYVIEYYFSNPGTYPPSFYYIPEGRSSTASTGIGSITGTPSRLTVSSI